MIDEAHERSLNIDIIIGLLTQALPRYPRLKLIIASATISADLFIDHFRRHLPAKIQTRTLLIGDETKKPDANSPRSARDQATSTCQLFCCRMENQVAPVERTWFLKPADNCELMEFDGKSFRVDPHFHDEDALDYAHFSTQIQRTNPKAKKSKPACRNWPRQRTNRWRQKRHTSLEGNVSVPQRTRRGQGTSHDEIFLNRMDLSTKNAWWTSVNAGVISWDFSTAKFPIQSCCDAVIAEKPGNLPCELIALPLLYHTAPDETE